MIANATELPIPPRDGQPAAMTKTLIAFDLDGTLAASKQSIDREMAQLFAELLAFRPVAVISGGDWPQFERQLLGFLPVAAPLARLYLLPTSGTKYYRFDGEWRQIYADTFSPEDRDRILKSLATAITDGGLDQGPTWGERIEDRGSQITFSGLGQAAPPDEKAKWDSDIAKRTRLKAVLDRSLPDFAVRIGGSTSVDITRPGVDKAYGMRKLTDQSGFALGDMLFMGDALYPGGNDAPVRDAGIATIGVRDISDTKRVIETILKFGGALPLATHV